MGFQPPKSCTSRYYTSSYVIADIRISRQHTAEITELVYCVQGSTSSIVTIGLWDVTDGHRLKQHFRLFEVDVETKPLCCLGKAVSEQLDVLESVCHSHLQTATPE